MEEQREILVPSNSFLNCHERASASRISKLKGTEFGNPRKNRPRAGKKCRSEVFTVPGGYCNSTTPRWSPRPLTIGVKK